MTRRLRHDTHGATAVEFALVLPVLLALLAGMLEFGRAMWIRQDMQFAVEEAVRYALAEDAASASTITAIALARMGGMAAGVVVTSTLAADSVTVTASTDFAPVLSGFLPSGTVTLSARARMPR